MTSSSIFKMLTFAGVIACSGGVQAATWEDSNGITWTYTGEGGNKVRITDAKMSDGSRLTGEITVPEKFGDGEDAPIPIAIGVTAAAGKNAAFNGSTVTKVTLPSSVTTLYGAGSMAGAFANCKSLLEFYGPGVTKLDNEGVFRDCTSLLHVELAQNVPVTIGNQAFRGCSSLTNLVVTTTQLALEEDGGQFRSCSALRGHWDLSHLTALPTYCFCEAGIESLNIKNARRIEASSLYKTGKLKSIIFSPNLEYIGNTAFYLDAGRSLLSGYVVFTNMTGFGEQALRRFYFITNLTVSIGRRNLKVGAQAFREQTALTNALIEAKIDSFDGESVFAGCTRLRDVRIPLLRKIASKTFSVCNALVDKDDVYTPQVTNISTKAFENCSGLKEYKIPYAVRTLGKSLHGTPSKEANLPVTNVFLHVGSPMTEDYVRANGFTYGSAANPYPRMITRYGGTNQVGDALWYTDDILPHLEQGATSVLGATGLTGDVVIPKRLGDKKVTAIEAGAFMDYTTNVVKSIQVPKDVSSIGFGAFPDYCEIKLHTGTPDELRKKMINYYGAEYITSWQDGFMIIVR